MQTLRGFGRSHDIATPLLDGAWQSNAAQNRLVGRKLARVLPNLRGARIAVLGLTYKPDTSTLRRSAALEVIAELTQCRRAGDRPRPEGKYRRGKAVVRLHCSATARSPP